MRTKLAPQTVLAATLLATWLASVFAPPAAPAQSEDPWATLGAVRESLVTAGPTAAEFVQTYVPAGFSSGEQESGQLAIALPDCLRWDYREPYPKVFLLCGESAHYWNPEDGTGRRFEVDREEEPGLDLVLLEIEDLRRRYRVEIADGEALENGGDVIHLVPNRRSTHLSTASLIVDPESRRLVELSYQDEEGNLTRFQIRGYRPLGGREIFSPPEGIEWREGEEGGS